MNTHTYVEDSLTNIDWVTAVEQHPETTMTDVLVAWDIVGAPTDCTEDQVVESIAKFIQLALFEVMHISDDGDWTYRYSTPPR